MMVKLSNEDTVHIQMLCEQGFQARYADKNWSLNILQTICHRVDKMGSA